MKFLIVCEINLVRIKLNHLVDAFFSNAIIYNVASLSEAVEILFYEEISFTIFDLDVTEINQMMTLMPFLKQESEIFFYSKDYHDLDVAKRLIAL